MPAVGFTADAAVLFGFYARCHNADPIEVFSCIEVLSSSAKPRRSVIATRDREIRTSTDANTTPVRLRRQQIAHGTIERRENSAAVERRERPAIFQSRMSCRNHSVGISRPKPASLASS
jgi:hypothetical protein